LWVRVPPPELSKGRPAGGPSAAPNEGLVTTVVHLGFEVRVALDLEGEGPISAQVTRNEADQLELVEGGVVWVRTAQRPAVPA
jgi:sulfate/thiosulfate transport system ATP-binding protein